MRDYSIFNEQRNLNNLASDVPAIAVAGNQNKTSTTGNTKATDSIVSTAPSAVSTTESTETTSGNGAPTLKLPTLNLDDSASVTNQRDKILRYDSLPMQQARTQAREQGVPSGQIHSSQQEGAAMRAMSDEATSLGEQEASLAAGEQISNWNNKTTEATAIYTNQYAERLAKMGYDASMAETMAALNTSLSQSMLSSYTTLANNTDIDLDQGITDKLFSIVNSAQDNNNIALGMGFTY